MEKEVITRPRVKKVVITCDICGREITAQKEIAECFLCHRDMCHEHRVGSLRGRFICNQCFQKPLIETFPRIKKIVEDRERSAIEERAYLEPVARQID